MATWARQTALMTMSSPLGDDQLIPISLVANEQISQPFTFDVHAVCQQGVVDPNTLLNQPCCITLQNAGTPVRYFHGIVQAISAEGAVRGQAGVDQFQTYHLVLVPKLWFLNQTVDCRVYQKKSAADIIKAMFQDLGLTDFSGPPTSTEREYTVQFNETDLHFATRLMEEEGWFYFFEHEASQHTVVIANQNQAFKAIAGADLHTVGGETDGTYVGDFNHAAVTARGKMKFKDYDPVKPDTLLENEQPTTLKTAGAPTRDDFRWPALTFETDTVTDRTKREMEAAEATASLFDGTTRFGGIVPGGKFTLASLPASPYDDTYVVQSTIHQVSDETWITGGGTADYSNRFTCFPASVTWRQPLITPRPRMDGIHTAIVLGPDGEEIYTDDLARVKVQFYWDHRKDATPDMAVWARVIMPWAGKGWGAQFIPRVGTEVAVAFVDGDPDRPIVVGGLYNGRDTPIYSKADKTKSGIRTRSSLKGGTSDFNEYTFDDNKGSELVYEQAQKDLTTYVKHDQTLKIDNCRIVTVKKDETVDIQNNQTIKIKQDHSLTVTDGNHSIDIAKGNHSFKVDTGNHDVTVAMGNMSSTVSMGNHSTDVKMGNVSLKAGLGAITDEAMQSITLSVGGSSIKIDQMGVTITGMMIKIQGQVQTQIQGLITQVNADAMLMVKGAITMIN
jgi:type VI secretion system secreted protein VgrG